MVSEDGKLIFVKPYETQETFKDFLRDVRIQEETHEDGDVNAHNARTTHAALNGVVKYAQTREWFLPSDSRLLKVHTLRQTTEMRRIRPLQSTAPIILCSGPKASLSM